MDTVFKLSFCQSFSFTLELLIFPWVLSSFSLEFVEMSNFSACLLAKNSIAPLLFWAENMPVNSKHYMILICPKYVVNVGYIINWIWLAKIWRCAMHFLAKDVRDLLIDCWKNQINEKKGFWPFVHPVQNSFWLKL